MKYGLAVHECLLHYKHQRGRLPKSAKCAVVIVFPNSNGAQGQPLKPF